MDTFCNGRRPGFTLAMALMCAFALAATTAAAHATDTPLIDTAATAGSEMLDSMLNSATPVGDFIFGIGDASGDTPTYYATGYGLFVFVLPDTGDRIAPRSIDRTDAFDRQLSHDAGTIDADQNRWRRCVSASGQAVNMKQRQTLSPSSGWHQHTIDHSYGRYGLTSWGTSVTMARWRDIQRRHG